MKGRLQLITSSGREADGQRAPRNAPAPDDVVLDAYSQSVFVNWMRLAQNRGFRFAQMLNHLKIWANRKLHQGTFDEL